MISPDVLMPFLVAALAICVAPGPDMAFVVASGVSAGRRGGVLAAVGITVGVSVYVVLTALGVGTLIRTIPAFAEVIALAGAAYLGYLALTTWRAAGSQATGEDLGSERRSSSIFWRGTITNLTNPKVVLFFAAFLTQFVDPGRGSVALQLLALGLMLQAVGLVVDVAIGLAAGTVRDVFVRKPGLYALLDRVAAFVLAALAAALVAEAFL
ncbi:MAG: LysE family translocator [Actinomycetota bacterium]|nr:LysE family translocator [Actinomycetota bacterium]